MANRLQLDFSIESREDRSVFVNEYVERPEFVKKPLTSDELETIADYILWGKDANGLNARQTGDCGLRSKRGTWDTNPAESLDGLMEQPGFNEASLSPLDSVPIRVKREVFSREKALAECPDYLRPIFIDLFRQIDELDLKINYYDLAHNRRKNPPREQLLAKFTDEEKASFQECVSHWTQYKYLKLRHELVDLRREQYNLKDQYAAIHAAAPQIVTDYRDSSPYFDSDIIVRPVGIVGTGAAALAFRPWASLVPGKYTEEELRTLSEFYWAKKAEKPGNNQYCIDFRDLEHVYQLLD